MEFLMTKNIHFNSKGIAIDRGYSSRQKKHQKLKVIIIDILQYLGAGLQGLNRTVTQSTFRGYPEQFASYSPWYWIETYLNMNWNKIFARINFWISENKFLVNISSFTVFHWMMNFILLFNKIILPFRTLYSKS